MKILVSGGAGFIGSSLADKLIKLGHQVVIIDNLSSGKKDYLNPAAKFYNLDINDQKIAEVFAEEKFDFVYHLAAQIDVRKSVADPIEDNRVNVLGGLNILKNCFDFKVKKIFFSSTGGALYGEADVLPTPETYPSNPLSPYGINKLTFEKYLHYYSEVYGQKYLVLRFANVYGPRQYKGGEAGVIAIFTANAVNNRPSQIFGDGLQTRDYIFIDDVVSALVSALEVDYVGALNIATGVETSLLDLVSNLGICFGSKVEYSLAPAKAGEQRRSCLSNALAKQVLNWGPKVDLASGLQATLKWAKEQREE